MKNLKELPSSITVTLDEDGGISYPVAGEFETSFEVELVCFNRKTFLQTWPLRQRVMLANTQLMTSFKDLFESADGPSEEASDEPIDIESFKRMLLMGGFDARAAMEEFKQAIVASGLIKITESLAICKNRWQQVDDVAKETILFTYLATFIQPCVV